MTSFELSHEPAGGPAAELTGEARNGGEIRGADILSAERIDLGSLVHHRGAIPHDLALEDVHRLFREQSVDFLALVREGRVTGICSRTRVGFMLGSRFGFALNSRSPAHAAQVEHPLVFTVGTQVRRVLDRALGRPAGEFHEDVVLVNPEHGLIGLVPVQVLARLQTRLVSEQMAAMRTQHEVAHRQNLELFQANQALRQTQGLYRALFESNAVGVALLDQNGEVQEHNRRCTELLGVESGRAGSFSLRALVVEREQMEFGQLLTTVERQVPVRGAREIAFEVAGRGPRLLRVSLGWIRETSQICACLDDVTEQRAIERRLQGQEKQLLLDTLVGGITHELNNKLTPVLGFAQLLELEASERGRGYVTYINKSVVEASAIIRQLLQLAKPETGQPQLVNLGALVTETVTILKFQLRAARVVVHTQTPPDPEVVFADPAQLKQVVMNLVINAVHAMGRAVQPRLGLVIGRRDGFGQLSVTDCGVGISPENLARIFDPFFTTKGPDEGSGLGLSICRSLVRSLGGEITVESALGSGARFEVTLPLAATDAVQRPESATPFARPRGGGPAVGQRVLIVEDEEVVRKFLQEALRVGFGCRVDVVQDGVAALRQALVERYELVISDVRMPGINGPEFYRRLIVVRPELRERFVFVTGHEGEESLVTLRGEVCVPLLAKPFTMQRLQEVCGPLLRSAEEG